jgi:hypothetical protein
VKIDEMKLLLGQILAEEEGEGSIDWNSVEGLSGELQVPIPLIVNEYLRGMDRRRQDSVFDTRSGASCSISCADISSPRALPARSAASTELI